MYKLWIVTACLYAWSPSMSLSAGDTRQVVEAAIKQASLEEGVDYKTMRAIATVESSLNPKAKGAIGEVGLFQLRPELFASDASYDPLINARAAAKYLKYVEKKCRPKYGRAWLICYNTGPYRKNSVKQPLKFSYYVKVMSVKRQRVMAGDM